jgi:hypothetical protein
VYAGRARRWSTLKINPASRAREHTHRQVGAGGIGKGESGSTSLIPHSAPAPPAEDSNGDDGDGYNDVDQDDDDDGSEEDDAEEDLDDHAELFAKAVERCVVTSCVPLFPALRRALAIYIWPVLLNTEQP